VFNRCREISLAVTESRSGWVSPSLRAVDVDAGYADVRRPVVEDAVHAEQLADEPKWPAWRVTVAVGLFCAAFWAGIYAIGSAIFQWLA
jgi:hypothetical protein